MILQVFLAFVGTVGFSIIFNVPRKELLFCGLAGAMGWFIYQLNLMFFPYALVTATFLAAATVTCISRIVSTLRRMPATIYMIPGIIPLVPGIGIYYTMFSAVMGDYTQAMLWGVHTLRIAGVIAVGLLVVLTLPRKWFLLGRSLCFSVALLTLAACGVTEEYAPVEDEVPQLRFEGFVQAGDYEFLWPEGRDRDWEEDIVFFASRFVDGHPLLTDLRTPVQIMADAYVTNVVREPRADGYFYHPDMAHELRLLHDPQLRAEFLEIINELIERIPKLDDFEIIMALSRSIAILPDDHAWISLAQGYGLAITPVLLFDGQHSPYPQIYIRDAYARDLVNTKILAINGIYIDEILDKLRPFVVYTHETHFRTLLSGRRGIFLFRDVLQYIGVVNDEDAVSITARDADGNVLTAQVPFVDSFGEAQAARHDFYWYEFHPEKSMLYLRISTFFERMDLPSRRFAQEIIDLLKEQEGVETFVIDLRGNGGGMSLPGILRFFHWTLEEENRALLGNIYVAIDFYSFSQSINQAVLFRDFVGGVTVIGSPSGGSLNIFTAPHGSTALPNSGIAFNVTTRANILDPDAGFNTPLYPDVFVYSTFEDFVNNHDAVIAAIGQRAGR